MTTLYGIWIVGKVLRGHLWLLSTSFPFHSEDHPTSVLWLTDHKWPVLTLLSDFISCHSSLPSLYSSYVILLAIFRTLKEDSLIGAFHLLAPPSVWMCFTQIIQGPCWNITLYKGFVWLFHINECSFHHSLSLYLVLFFFFALTSQQNIYLLICFLSSLLECKLY